MKRIHNLKRTIALFLAMLMAATSTAFANWDSFQGSDDNNGLTDVAISSITGTPTTVTLPNNGAFTGVDVEPLVHGSRIYALYNGGTPKEDGTGGARLACADASSTSTDPLWTIPVDRVPAGEGKFDDTRRANNVSQIATPVITEDGKTLYGTYTYTQNMLDGKTVSFSGDYSDGKIGANGTATATITGVTLPGGYGNLQVGTDITSTGDNQQTGTVTIKNGDAVVQSFTSSSFGTYNFNVYYSDGAPVPGGTYTIEVSVQNNADTAIPWSSVSLLVNRWMLFRVDGIDGSDPQVTHITLDGIGYAGQASTPLTLSGNYLYFGIFDGDRAYYQYRIAQKDIARFDPPGDDQFYWAGALVKDGRVYFGSEQGVVYVCEEAAFSNKLGNMYVTGGAHIRSSMVLKHHSAATIFEGDFLYFTSTDGNLWRIQISGDSVIKPEVVSLGKNVASSSTPTILKDGYVYVGYYEAGWGTTGGVKRVPTASFNDNSVQAVYTGDKVQSSPVVYQRGGTDYVCFTTNVENGTGYCYNGNGTPVWSVPSGNFALQGFAMGSYTTGTPPFGSTINFAVFGNDNGQLVIVEDVR